jgi:hypothetical protein
MNREELITELEAKYGEELLAKLKEVKEDTSLTVKHEVVYKSVQEFLIYLGMYGTWRHQVPMESIKTPEKL